MLCINKVLQFVIMIHNIQFNKIIFIVWSKMFIIPKHIFYDLSYMTIMSNIIKEMTKNVFNTNS
jgi:hypothetical protein